MKTLWISLRAYVRPTGKLFWIILMEIILAFTGATLDIGGFATFPTWLWVLLFFIAALIAPFLAFHNQRLQMDILRAKCGMVPLEDEKTFFDHPLFPGIIRAVFWVLFGAILVAAGVWLGREYLKPETQVWGTKIEMKVIPPEEAKTADEKKSEK